MTSKGIEIITVAEASAEHPRHSSASMIELKDSSVLMAWIEFSKSNLEHAAGDDAPADIVAMASRDGGRSWGNYRTLIQRGPNDTSAYSPAFLRLRDGNILFKYELYHRFVRNEDCCISACACRSRDECKTFSSPVTIWNRSARHMGFQNDVRQLSTGRLIVPAVVMKGKILQDDGKGLSPAGTMVCGCFYSDNQGKTWEECESYVYLPMRGAMEPGIEELKDGRLVMVMRTQLGSVFKSISSDGGRTWSKAQTTGLHSPESYPALARIPQTGDLLLVWNHSLYDPKFDHYGKRTPLSVAISRDDGCTWEKIKDIETDPGWEFTNPSVMATSQGAVLITYEASKYVSVVPPGKLGRSRMSLKLAIVYLDWLYDRPILNEKLEIKS